MFVPARRGLRGGLAGLGGGLRSGASVGMLQDISVGLGTVPVPARRARPLQGMQEWSAPARPSRSALARPGRAGSGAGGSGRPARPLPAQSMGGQNLRGRRGRRSARAPAHGRIGYSVRACRRPLAHGRPRDAGRGGAREGRRCGGGEGRQARPGRQSAAGRTARLRSQPGRPLGPAGAAVPHSSQWAACRRHPARDGQCAGGRRNGGAAQYGVLFGRASERRPRPAMARNTAHCFGPVPHACPDGRAHQGRRTRAGRHIPQCRPVRIGSRGRAPGRQVAAQGARLQSGLPDAPRLSRRDAASRPKRRRGGRPGPRPPSQGAPPRQCAPNTDTPK